MVAFLFMFVSTLLPVLVFMNIYKTPANLRGQGPGEYVMVSMAMSPEPWDPTEASNTKLKFSAENTVTWLGYQLERGKKGFENDITSIY